LGMVVRASSLEHDLFLLGEAALLGRKADLGVALPGSGPSSASAVDPLQSFSIG
jgi:hypothetical protein